MSVMSIQNNDKEKQSRNEGRLPPGQLLTEKFPVLHYGSVPPFNASTWDFKVWGEVEQPLQLSWIEFNQLPHTQALMDIHCVTRWSKFDTLWEGIAFSTLVDEGLIKLKNSAKYVLQHT